MPRSNNPGDIKVGPGLAAADSIEQNALISPASGAAGGLDAHIGDPVDAHDASAVSLGDESGSYDGDDAQEGFDELAALVPPRPPTVGNFLAYMTNSGITDWGELKQWDAGVIANTTVVSTNLDSTLYPYYHFPPNFADDDPPFDTSGRDPDTDTTFNIDDGTYTGGGPGLAFPAGFTRGTDIIETGMTYPSAGAPNSFAIVSGMVYPADRGVLAIIHIPAGGTIAGMTGLPLAERCLGALLLGQGIVSGCDGDSGAIFTIGDPYVFPGRATGQFDLDEHHTGISTTGGLTPPPADTNAGRVRLGYDILGAKTSASAPAIGRDNRNDNNFFRYRLPYMGDYDTVTGLDYTPTVERVRFFDKPTIALDAGNALLQAGDYTNFPKDYWTFQVARYRYRFEFPTVAVGDRDMGSFVLLHFKTEAAFEALINDGTAPLAADVYSANLVDWADAEATTNITAGAAASPAYHVLRSSVFEDTTGISPAPTFSTVTWDYVVGGPATTTSISGIRYFIPGGGTPFSMRPVDVVATTIWDNTYRTSDDNTAGRVTTGMEMVNPGFLYVGAFNSGSSFTIPAGIGTVASQRVEFDYTELDFTSGHGAFALANGPLPADDAAFQIGGGGAGLIPLGDPTPHFSRDAVLRMFFRRPLGANSTGSASFGSVLAVTDGKTILFNSTDGSIYLNPATATTSPAGTETILKDTEDDFLDEVYRYDAAWPGVTPAADQNRLVGPGLPVSVNDIEVAVRPGSSVTANWVAASWIQTGAHLATLVGTGEAQVAGCPDRNPPITDGVAEPIPSAGVLIYPQTDFSDAGSTRPSQADGDVVGNQFNYSAEAGDREYVRAFDAGFKRSASPVVAENQSLFTLQVRGLQLADFAYSAPGPGNLNIAIMIKVPGRTTWMDAGRVDGGGPSKQDTFSDGAGCQVVGIDTVDSVNGVTGIVECQVRINVGGAQTLFLTAATEVPVLVKVIIKDSAGGKALDLTQGGVNGTAASIRGLIGLGIVHPSA